MKRDAISLSLNLGTEQLVDNFAGGGGASTGIEMAFGRPVDVAINHDGEALAMHAANHPTTRHYREDVFDIHPGLVTGEQPIGLAWFSPDCKHHSKAKGGKPREQKIRGLAWVTLKWATFQAPRCIALENVEEFQDWGPLDDEGRPIKSEKGRTFRAFIDALTTGLAVDHPDAQEIYETLGADFPMERLYAGLGYKAEYRVLRACDYDTPTIRKRLYVFARRDGLPIVWPAPTHGDPKSETVRSGRLLPWRTAAECIDWSIPCPSIFERARPLKDATLRRIAKGIMKFVVNSDAPFIVKFQENSTGQVADQPLHTVMAGAPRFGIVEPFLVSVAHSTTTGRGPNVWSTDEPVRTVTSSNDKYVVAPTLMHVTHQGVERNAALDVPLATVTGAHRGDQAIIAAHITKMRTGSTGSDLGQPLHTVTAGGEQARPGTGNAMGIVSATLIQTGYGEREGQEPRVPGLDKPLGTAVAGGVKHAVVTAFLAQHNKERSGVKAGRAADVPLSTVTTSGTQQQLVTALLAKHYGGHETPGSSMSAPISTVATQDHHHLVTAQLVGCGGRAGQSRPRDVSEPAATVTAKADTTVVTSHLLKLRNNQFGQDVRDPIPTLTAGGGHVGEVRALLQKYHGADALGIVTINGEQFAIVDIGMRMLTPRELARAQGFPDSYVLNPIHNGKPLSKSAQVRMIGNSVCPPVAAAIIRANFTHEQQMAGVAA
ncbi:DNA cytosine methyltransferase [Paraburkholderia sp. SARCC-3016]|uniref:DNA cytosine methyltransferase n=1 Tax=Paraburkholderia sp. SARCC-3016 TaxID=3058611 RepID=UPI002808F142|nr:DNA cytosine methyltransferase [Paraburkholderia sp. SARCC-3016]MDQ7981881.1 DNA cytosine methyltransferase [Paraburkholderia sp. SARCC-3016]